MPHDNLKFEIDLFDLAKELLACAVAAGPGKKREKLLQCVALLQPGSEKDEWAGVTAPSSSALH